MTAGPWKRVARHPVGAAEPRPAPRVKDWAGSPSPRSPRGADDPPWVASHPNASWG